MATDPAPPSDRRWRFWQVESSIACDLDCVMCPWPTERRRLTDDGAMSDEVWARLRPHLPDTDAVDFSGSGEPLMHPRLSERIAEAHAAGCRTGLLTNGNRLDPERIARFIGAGLDWIGFSVDGADARVYNRIRRGGDFDTLRRNIAEVVRQKDRGRPLVVANVLLMEETIEQLEDIARLAAELGIDEIVYKQCDVSRDAHGRDRGLFEANHTAATRRYAKRLEAAETLTRKLGLGARSYAFVPDELPVCGQDPRHSLFVRYDGQVAPCASLARGGEGSFLGKPTQVTAVSYGNVLRDDLAAIWEREPCRSFRETFERRARAHAERLQGGVVMDDPFAFVEAMAAANEAMPEPPEPCRECHYLFDI